MTTLRLARLAFLLVAGVVSSVVSAHPGSGIVVDAHGRVHFVDTGGGIYRVDGGGRLTREPGPAFHWMAVDDAGLFRKTRLPVDAESEMRAEGSDPTLILSSDFPVTVANGALFFARPGEDGRVRIHRLAPDGRLTVHAILPARTESGELHWLGGIAAGPDGSLYYTDRVAVRRIDRDGTVRTVASAITVSGCVKVPGYAADSGPDLRGLAVAPDGTVYVAASGCAALVRVGRRGEVDTLLRTESPWSPTGVALSGSDVYVLEYTHTASDDRREWLPRVRKVGRDGKGAVVAAIERR